MMANDCKEGHGGSVWLAGHEGACLQLALIEHVGGEERQRRVHAVLHSQPVWPHAQHHQPLKQRLAQPRARRLHTPDTMS
jgi:hypothetical protein